MNLLKGVLTFFFLLPCALLIPAINTKVYRELETNSVLFKDLKTPLSFVPGRGVSPMVWLRYNPAYGAVLWRNNAIDALSVIVGSSAIEEDCFPLVRKALGAFFKEIGFMHTTTEKKLKKRKMGILAGYLYLLQVEIIDQKLFRERIQEKCDWAVELELQDLFSKQLFEKEQDLVLNSLVPAIVSSYAYVIASQLEVKESSKTYLNTYREDFYGVISQFFPLQEQGNSNSENEDHGIVFHDLICLLIADFAANDMPIATELNLSLPYRSTCFANCAESTFINWLIGAHYNPNSLQLELTDRINNEVIVAQLHGKCGFEASYNIQRVVEQLENLSFVSYANLMRKGTIFKAEDQEGSILGFIKLPSSKMSLLSNSVTATIGDLEGKLIPSVSFYNGSYFVIDELLVQEDLLYEICPEPLNFLVLAHHLGETVLRNLYITPWDLFGLCQDNKASVEFIFKTEGAMQCTKFNKFEGEFELKFPFGKMLLHSSHAVFKFDQRQDLINKGDYSIIEEDSILFKMYNSQKNIHCPFGSVFCAILEEKECVMDVTEAPLHLPIYCLLRKIFRVNYYQRLLEYIQDKFPKWFKAFMEPKFQFQNQSTASFLVGEFIAETPTHIALSIENHLCEFQNDQKIAFYSILALEYGKYYAFDIAEFDIFFQKIGGERIDLFFQMKETASLKAATAISQEILSNDLDVGKAAQILSVFTHRFQKSEKFITNLWTMIEEKENLIPLYASGLRNCCLRDKPLYPTVLLAFLQRNNLDLFGGDIALMDSNMQDFKSIFNCFIRPEDIASLKEAHIAFPHSRFLATLIESISNSQP